MHHHEIAFSLLAIVVLSRIFRPTRKSSTTNSERREMLRYEQIEADRAESNGNLLHFN